MIAIGGAIGTGLFLGQFARGAHRRPRRHHQLSDRCGHRAALHECAVGDGSGSSHRGLFWSLCRALCERMGGLHRPLHILGGAMHCHRRRSHGHRHLLPVVVPEYSEMGMDSRILGRSVVHQRSQRRELRQLRILVRDDQGGGHRSVHRFRSGAAHRARSRAGHRLLELHRARWISSHRLARRVDGDGVRDLQLHRNRSGRGHRRRGEGSRKQPCRARCDPWSAA